MQEFVVRPIGVVRSALKDAQTAEAGALTGQEAEIVVDRRTFPR